MPIHKNVRIVLLQPETKGALPEYPPPPWYPQHVEGNTVSIFVPSDRHDGLWVQYTIFAPLPQSDKPYYFELLFNGQCIQTWHCGPESKYTGVIGHSVWASKKELRKELRSLDAKALAMKNRSIDVNVYSVKGIFSVDQEQGYSSP
jgi:hypothetical protein